MSADPALQALIAHVTRHGAVGCAGYKESCLRRRVAVRMRARGIHSLQEYAQLVERDAGECERLVDALTIHVTKFFRNREAWDALTARLMPDWWSARRGRVACWSAGCASGEEAYTLAIILSEALRTHPLAGARVQIDGTDLDVASLELAGRGGYAASALDETPPALRERYFERAGAAWIVAPIVRNMVRLRRHDLTRDAPPGPQYDLIVCRNVVIYFQRSLQERLYASFADVLAPDGLLMLGKTETLVGAARARFALENLRERIYRRLC